MINNNMYDFFLIGILGILLIFSFGIGLQRMTKVVIGSYILMAISISIISLIDFLVIYLTGANITIIKNIGSVISFLSNGKYYINMVFYFIFFFLIYKKFDMVKLDFHNQILKMIFTVLLAPLTVMSVISTLFVASFGYQILDSHGLMEFASRFESNVWIYRFILFIPLWIALPGVFSLLISIFFGGSRPVAVHMDHDE